MARPRSRSPRHKHRSYSSSYGSAPELQEGMPFVGPCGSESRDYRAQPGRPVRWRDPKGSGPAPGSHYEKSAARPMLPDERRAPAEPFHRPTPPWRVQSGSYHGYPPQPRHHSPGPYHSHRRLSPPRPAHPPPPPRRLSPSGPAHGPAPHRRPSPRGAFHGPNFNRTQRPSSPRHFHGPPGNRRPPSPAPLHGFVAHRRAHSPERDGGRWRPGPPADHQRSNCPDRAPRGRSRSPRAGRERPRAHSFDRSAREERWNGGLHLSPRHSRERRYSFSPPRVSEGFPGRISYTEKHLGRPAQPGYSAERELRKHSETTENRNAEWGEATHQYWSPKWKADPSSPRYHQERAGDARREVHRPLKCRGREGRSSSSSSSSSCSANAQIGRSLKYPRGDMPDRFQKPKSFGSRETEGSSASSHSRDEAQLKGRKKRPVLVGGTKASPPQHREPEKVLKKHSKLPGKDVASLRLSVAKQKVVNKLRSTAALSKAPPPPQGKTTGKKNQRKPHHKLPLTGSSTTDEGAAQTETLTIKVDTRHSMTRYSSSAHSDRQLSRDLVTASRLASELQPRAKHVGPWRERALKNQTGDFDQDLITLVHQVKENYFRHDNLTLNERFSKLHYSKSFSQEDGRRYSGLKISRQIELPSPNHKEMKPVKKIGPTQQSSFHSGSPNHRPAHLIKNSVVESPGHFRHFKKPLMGSLSLRLGVQQKPVFKKSLSIQSKYRNLQSLRQRGPHGRGAGSRRW